MTYDVVQNTQDVIEGKMTINLQNLEYLRNCKRRTLKIRTFYCKRIS